MGRNFWVKFGPTKPVFGTTIYISVSYLTIVEHTVSIPLISSLKIENFSNHCYFFKNSGVFFKKSGLF